MFERSYLYFLYKICEVLSYAQGQLYLTRRFKQSRTADKGWPSSLRFVRWANNFSYDMLHRGSDFAGSGEHGNEILGSIKDREFLD